MITIRHREKRNNRTIIVSGHAGAAEPGKDIFCAAASTLMMTLLSALDRAEIDAIEIVGDGYVYVQCTDAGAEMIYYTVLTGYYTLAMNYPEYYRVETL